MRLSGLTCALLVGCAPMAATPWPDATVRVLATLAQDGSPSELRVIDQGALLPTGAGLGARLLSYDRPLEELLVAVREDGVIPFDPDGLPLARPTSARELTPEGLGEPLGETELGTWLAKITVAAPPCPSSEPTLLRVVGPAPKANVSFALPLGDRVLVGFEEVLDFSTLERVSMPSVYSIGGPDDARRLEDFELPGTSSAAESPAAALEGEDAWVLFPRLDTSSAADYELSRLDSGGALLERFPTSFARALLPGRMDGVSLGPYFIRELAVTRVAGERRFVARGQPLIYESPTMQPLGTGSLVELDAATGEWTPLEARRSERRPCQSAYESGALSLAPDGTLWAQRGNTALASFDLGSGAWGGPLLGIELVCGSAHLTLADGSEVAALHSEQGGFGRSHLAWRPKGGAWSPIRSGADEEGPPVDGSSLAEIPGGFAASGRDETILWFRYSPARPELPPRQCGAGRVYRRAVALQMLPNGLLFVGSLGSKGPDTANFIDLRAD